VNYNVLSAPFDVSLHLTHTCNLHCLHCYLRAGNPSKNELTPEEMERVLDKLIEMKIFRILLTGGEPMLREDFFDIIKKLHQKMWMILSTNGNFIDEDNIEEISKYIKEYIISLDGATARNHDKFRGVAGSFDKAIRAIYNINNFGNKDIRLVINSALNKYNIDEVEKIIDLAVYLNAGAIRFSVIYLKGRALDNKHIFLSNDEIKKVISRISQKKNTVNDIKILFDDSFLAPLKLYGYDDLFEPNKEKNGTNGNSCNVAKTMFSVMPNGDIIPCDLFQESPEFIIGNALRDDLLKLWKESKILNDLRTSLKSPYICRSCKNENKCITIRCAAIIMTNDYSCNWYESK
jgi:radical SAM protein with 4Fe4S-binding SPASM domain